MRMDVAEGPALLIKKVAGLFLILLGFAGIAFGVESGSTGLLVLGVVAALIGIALLALKIVRRNAGQ